MKKITVSRNEICEAIEKATPNLKPTQFVHSESLKETYFTKHCKVCAVGAVAQQIPKIRNYVNKKAKERLTGYPRDDWDNLYTDILDTVVETTLVKGRAAVAADFVVEYEIGESLEKGNYFSALSIYFEDFLDQDDSNELKSGALQNFVLSFFPPKLEIFVP